MKHRFLYQQPINQMKKRLRKLPLWFPYPALISFGLIMVLTGYTIPNLNTYFGHPSNLIEQDMVDGIAPEGSIWFSVSVRDHNLVISTFNRKVFKWDRKIKNIEVMSDFIDFLKDEIKARTLQAALAAGIGQHEVTATIATDRGLKFLHIRPIINALAAAGISNYSFEVKRINYETSEDSTNKL